MGLQYYPTSPQRTNLHTPDTPDDQQLVVLRRFLTIQKRKKLMNPLMNPR